MKYQVIVILIVFVKNILAAQNNDSQLVGNFILRGEREVASGFQLKDDHSFEFFLSYGALDRIGMGNWAIVGDSIVLNSNASSIQDFELIKSEKRNYKGIKLKISNPIPYLNELILAKFNNSQSTDLLKADGSGNIFFDGSFVDDISLVFRFCPDKISKYTNKNKLHNYFEFKMLPSIFNVNFKNFKLKIETDKLQGSLSFFDEKVFDFVKEK